MKFVLERLLQPTSEPVTLAEARRHLRLFDDITDDDADIETLITAGREWAEDLTGRTLIEETWRLTVGAAWPLGFLTGDAVGGYIGARNRFGYYAGDCGWYQDGGLLLRRSPVIAINSVKTVDAAGAETVVDPSTYELREGTSKYPRLVPLTGASWPGATLRVEYRSGYADTSSSPAQGPEMVPARFKLAIKLWVEAHYDRDEKAMPLLLQAATSLITPERVEMGFA